MLLHLKITYGLIKVRKFLFYISYNVLFLRRRTFFMLEFKTIEELKPNPKLLNI